MQPSFTYSDLQERFCEGFTFFPFSGLEQSGSLHARVLLLKLLQKDIPVANLLLSKLNVVSAGLEATFYKTGRASAMSRQLLETMTSCHRLLTVYQHQVQEPLVTQVSALCNKGTNTFSGRDILKSIERTREMVEEFLGSTDIMYDCLLACTLQAAGFRELMLSQNDLEELRDIMGMLEEFRNLQEKTIYVLVQLREEYKRYDQMNIMN